MTQAEVVRRLREGYGVRHWTQAAHARWEAGSSGPPDPDDEDGLRVIAAVSALLDLRELVEAARYEIRLRRLAGPEMAEQVAERAGVDRLDDSELREIVHDAAVRLVTAYDVLRVPAPPREAGRRAVLEAVQAAAGRVEWRGAGYLPAGVRRWARGTPEPGLSSWPELSQTVAEASLEEGAEGARWRRTIMSTAAPPDVADYVMTAARGVHIGLAGVRVLW